MKHETVLKWGTGLQFIGDLPGGEVKYDADEAVGGSGNGLRPKPTMLGALAGCTGMDVASLLRKMRTEPDQFRVEVSGDLTDEHPKVYRTVEVRYYFAGENLNQSKIEKAVDLSVNRYCGVYEMFRAFATINYRIIYE